MAFSASHPIINVKLEENRGSSVVPLPYPYFSKPNTQAEIWEIIDPEQEEGDALQGSFAISESIESFFSHLNRSGVRIGSPSSVRNYLYRYPNIIELVQFAVDSANSHFGAGLELSLDMYQDREAQFERLTLYVRQRTYDKKTMKTIKKIRRDYHQSFPDIIGRFLLTTDFRFPR